MSSPVSRRQARSSPCLFHKYNYPSIANLPDAITCNNITVLPTFRYNGKDATTSIWPAYGYGNTLTNDAIGTNVTPNNGSPLLGSLDDSVKFAGGNGNSSYSAATTFASTLTNDVVFEFIVGFNSTTRQGYCSNINTAVDNIGFRFYSLTNNAYIYLHQNATTAFLTNLGAIVSNKWHHFLFFYDNSLSTASALYSFVNGVWVESSLLNTPAANFNYASVGTLKIGRYSSNDTFYCCDGNVAYAAQYQQASWFSDSSFTELQTIASTRFSQLTGIYPNKATGTYLPSTATRNSTAYLDKLESNGSTKLYLVGTNWIRSSSKIDSLGNNVKGLLICPTATNIQTYSSDFTNNTTPYNSSITNTSVIGPDRNTYTVNTLKEDTTPGNAHYFERGAPPFLANTQYVQSLFVKAINRSWITLGVSSSAVLRCFFDISTGTAGAINGTATNKSSGIISYGSGWYRCWASAYGLNGTIPAIFIAEGDNDVVFDGLNQDSFYVWGHQIEVGNYPTSYIPTTTAAVIRAADIYRLSGQYNIGSGEGAIRWWFWMPTHTPSTTKTIETLSVGGSANDLINLYIDTDCTVKFASTATGGNAGAGSCSTNVCNDAIHEVLLTWKKNYMSVCVDGTWGTIDTLVDIPTGIDRLDIGCDQAGANQFGPGLLIATKHYTTYQPSFWNRGGGITHVF